MRSLVLSFIILLISFQSGAKADSLYKSFLSENTSIEEYSPENTKAKSHLERCGASQEGAFLLVFLGVLSLH